MTRWLFLAISLILLFWCIPNVWAIENEECLDCHEGEEAEEGDDEDDEGAEEIILQRFEKSIHGDELCVDCHTDITEEHQDEDEPVAAKVNCAECHDEHQEEFAETVHGKAAIDRKDKLAPTCASCHGSHYIFTSSDPESSTYVMNIPKTCGSCHKEGTDITKTHEIHQHNVVENYSMSIHGKGLLESGLIVTAVCTSCHGKHNILPHEHPESKINRENVTKTCMECHAQIEKVHEKTIQGHLWQKEPDKIPVCVECHPPHQVRQVVYDESVTDKACLACHSQSSHGTTGEMLIASLDINELELDRSVHSEMSCIKCHDDIHPETDTVCTDEQEFRKYLQTYNPDSGFPCKALKPVDCAICHDKEVEAHTNGIHGQLFAKDDPDAPDCSYCHTSHNTLAQNNPLSPTFPRNVPALCAQCHRDGEKAAIREQSVETEIVNNYSMSIHGRDLLEAGLIVSATCTSCHTPHSELPAKETLSSVHPGNIPQTCGACHHGINEQYQESVHRTAIVEKDRKLPSCNDCHSSHKVKRVYASNFRNEITHQCGDCHKELTESYFETYHGKASILGETGAAKCSDCHGAHKILSVSNSQSTLHKDNIITTCRQCHPKANENFAGYLTHASYRDKDKYPQLYYTYWFMTLLLWGTMGVFGIHNLLWLSRSIIEHAKQREVIEIATVLPKKEEKYYCRFPLIQIFLHLLVIVSFVSLVVTGMTLKFPDIEFFAMLSQLLGGPRITGNIHRLAAIITFLYFGIHLFLLVGSFRRREITLKGLLTEEYSMIPLKRDLIELKQNFLWFIGCGPQPKFGRWTYWEKFDYLAVFWGVTVIGLTGLILWFPEEATLILPGWMINVATVIHSDEALLAAAFIFIIHFFNTHFRPGKFPMDPVIFTGRVPLSEFKKERPREYQQMVESGELEKHLVSQMPEWFLSSARIFGLTFLIIGISIIFAILYAIIG